MKKILTLLAIGVCAYLGYTFYQKSNPATQGAAVLPGTPKTWPADAISVSVKDGIRFFGKQIPLEQLRPSIEGMLVTMAELPDQIPVQFEHEVLLSTRGQVTDEADAALDAVKSSRVKPILDAIISPLSTDLKTNVKLKVAHCKVENDFAFVIGIPQQPDGKPVDYLATPYAKAYQNRQYGPGVFALLKREGDYYKVVAMKHGALEIPFACWWKEYQTPKTIFPDKLVMEACH
jgi:hypothetical protein